MAKREISKNLMLSAGILAALVILCSQAFQKETRAILSKINTEKTDKTEKAADGEKCVVVATPSDAVTSGPAVEVGEAEPSFIREILLDDTKDSQTPVVNNTVVSEFLKTLMRVFIAPQAP